ncbi:hypothetical protein [Hymenobacter canadensis]|uniref:DUF4105 domain-containing protein n=1 Tax=Hymenobacter canadensis TaxID=2999067 RepID=A0ABY7LQV7_9BACT|nr:hypothetical protein [Hymenobacter canadensis]WBA42797.1 hypothetical protein O3303_04365 [Hymenobacter canadensis]
MSPKLQPTLLRRWLTRLELVAVVGTWLYVLGRTLLTEGDYRYVGRLPAGPEGWMFTLYQANEFDWTTAVDYELSYRGERQTGPYLLVGSTELARITDFQAGQCGPILYLAYDSYDSTRRVGAFYDTRWRPGYYDSLRFYGSFRQHRQIYSLLLEQVQQCRPELQLP